MTRVPVSVIALITMCAISPPARAADSPKEGEGKKSLQELLADLETRCAKCPESEPLNSRLAALYRKSGEHRKAAAIHMRFMKGAKGASQHALLAAESLWKAGKNEEAEAMVREHFESEAAPSRSLLMAAVFYRGAELWSKEEAVHERMAGKEEDPARKAACLLSAAQAASRANDTEACRRHAEAVVATGSKGAKARAEALLEALAKTEDTPEPATS